MVLTSLRRWRPGECAGCVCVCVYVCDHVQFVERCLAKELILRQQFHLGSGTGTSGLGASGSGGLGGAVGAADGGVGGDATAPGGGGATNTTSGATGGAGAGTNQTGAAAAAAAGNTAAGGGGGGGGGGGAGQAAGAALAPTSTNVAMAEEESRRDKEISEYHLVLGQLRYMQQRFPESEAALQETIQRDVENTDAWAQLGHLKFLTGEKEVARSCFERTLALRHEPKEFHAVLMRLGSLYLIEEMVGAGCCCSPLGIHPVPPSSEVDWQKLVNES